MLDSFKTRRRAKHIKLVRQNQLAAEQLYQFAKQVFESNNDPSMMQALEGAQEAQVILLDSLKTRNDLGSEISSDQQNLQKFLRSLYGEMVRVQNALTESKGEPTQTAAPYDQRFQPDEGWDSYVEQFGAA